MAEGARFTKNPAVELITIPEAMALLVDKGLDPDEARLFLEGALLGAKLLSGDQKGPDQFRGLAANLQHLSSRGVVEADLKAIRRLSRKLSIPWESWFKWIHDGSVDWKNSEIARDFGEQVVIFTPVFRREDLLSLVPTFDPTGNYAKEQIAPAATTVPSLKIIRRATGVIIRHALREVYSGYPRRGGTEPQSNRPARARVPEKQGLYSEQAADTEICRGAGVRGDARRGW
jgi:hypothetical protein